MPLALATLEGTNEMTTKLLSRPVPKIMRRPGRTHIVSSGFALYGTDEEHMGFQELGGWLTSLKKGVSSAASSVGSTVMDAARTVVDLNAKYSQPLLDKAFATAGVSATEQGGNVTYTNPQTGATIVVEGKKTPEWVMPAAIAGGALVLVLLLKRK